MFMVLSIIFSPFEMFRVEKEAKREEKLLTKQLERDKREAEKEKKRLETKVLKEKLQSVSAALLILLMFCRGYALFMRLSVRQWIFAIVTL